MPRIDLNCDLGEGAGHDAELMPLITSANIACGAHAGDEETMRELCLLAWQHGVALGAHPGFEDRENFGRREMPVTPKQVADLVFHQTRLLQEIALGCGGRVMHVKAHGALYHLAARDPALARAVAEGAREADPRLTLYGLAGSHLLTAGRACGLRVASEVFADRTYQADGSLTPRTRSNALIEDAALAVAQTLHIVRDGRVRALGGTSVALQADTVCLHGDGALAVEFATRLNRELAAAGIELKPFTA
ncbi:MAG: LamB/YcsF family protein [Opitutae bacterium]|nr:LamB/YcsF family protein [Opitutae bacterium]